MNEQLKFSWGHIIAFLALIFVSYVTFMGVTYLTGGEFLTAGISMVVIDVILFVLFIGGQIAKSTTRKFHRWIWMERICILGSPVFFCLCMIPYSHFWTVHEQNTAIVQDFTIAINASKQMFTDYEHYSVQRISNYEDMLGKVIKQHDANEMKDCGFLEGWEVFQKPNMIQTLQLQLLSQNYDSLKVEAISWIDRSSHGASTWNVFLIGNTKEIKQAIHDWHNQLASYAKNRMSNEEFSNYNQVVDFEFSSSSVSAMDKGLDDLSDRFSNMRIPNLMAIGTALLIYLMLLFPYLLQDRNTKSLCRLLGMKQQTSIGEFDFLSVGEASKRKEKSTFRNSSSTINQEDDYSSFTLN